MVKLEPLMLRIDDVAALTGVAKSTIYKMVRNGEFPRPIKFGEGPRASSLWSRAELVKFTESKLAARGPMLEAGPIDGDEILANRFRRARLKKLEAASGAVDNEAIA